MKLHTQIAKARHSKSPLKNSESMGKKGSGRLKQDGQSVAFKGVKVRNESTAHVSHVC